MNSNPPVYSTYNQPVFIVLIFECMHGDRGSVAYTSCFGMSDLDKKMEMFMAILR